MNIKLVGIDLAKNVFQVCALDPSDHVQFNRTVRRTRLLNEIRNLTPTTIAMESCSSAHYWGRQFQALGHQVKLIPAQHCKPFVRGGKNDARDALAICEAAARPGLHGVPVKSIAQQDLQLLHRVRERQTRQMTALANQLRAIGREYGVVIPEGIKALLKTLPGILEDATNDLSPVARTLIAELADEIQRLRTQRVALLQRIAALLEGQPAFERLQAIPGFGPVVASAFLAAIGNGHQFQNGRQVAAWLGLVPRQYGTGGKLQLYGITKNGDRYLRTMLIHGARPAVHWSKGRSTPLARWINPLVQRRGPNKAAVALANKMVRVGWNVLAKDEVFDEKRAFGPL
jgi:transposase